MALDGLGIGQRLGRGRVVPAIGYAEAAAEVDVADGVAGLAQLPDQPRQALDREVEGLKLDRKSVV